MSTDNRSELDGGLSALTGLVMPSTEDLAMPPVFDHLVKLFCEGAVQERERLEKKLLAMGYSPDTVTIAERTWYDEENYIMRFECCPVFKA